MPMGRSGVRWALGLWLSISACAHAAPPRALPPPVDAAARRESLDDLGKRLFDAIRERRIGSVLAQGDELDALLVPEARARIERERQRVVHLNLSELAQPWAVAQYAGFCAQGALQGGVVDSGLRGDGWQLDRILVVADLNRVQSASWVEGRFVFTDQGFKVLSLSRVEPPRARHADLELAPCDVERGIR
jgi:hypothetical protein